MAAGETIAFRRWMLVRGNDFNDAWIAERPPVCDWAVTWLQVDCDTRDWQTTAASDSITKTVMAHIGNGVIVLMHAGSQVESDTLDELITKIEQMKYQMVTVTQVIG